MGEKALYFVIMLFIFAAVYSFDCYHRLSEFEQADTLKTRIIAEQSSLIDQQRKTIALADKVIDTQKAVLMSNENILNNLDTLCGAVID